MKTIEDIMTKSILMIDVDAKVHDAAEMLEKHKIGSLVVTEGKETIGIVTERDITYRYVARPKREICGADLLVRDIMSKPLISLSIDANPNIMDVIVMMDKHKIKRVCITKKGKLVGVLAELDLFKELADSYVKDLKKMISKL
ncbi:MAG: CBS domain-containing protein [Candidatus Aenigmarchaeota archaeon]|nr:CBS domain-containing protein [Candidatus Aenigmarchaeota archaeon]MCK5176280.1 CBS domain-containing protein [Candidatus Aenigmarchaeota archaeon]